MEYWPDTDLQSTVYVYISVIGISASVIIYMCAVSPSQPCPEIHQLSNASAVISIGILLVVTVYNLIQITVSDSIWLTISDLIWLIVSDSIRLLVHVFIFNPSQLNFSPIQVNLQGFPRGTDFPENNSTTKFWNFPGFLKTKLVVARTL